MYKHETRLELQMRFKDMLESFIDISLTWIYSINNNFSFTQLINMALEDLEYRAHIIRWFFDVFLVFFRCIIFTDMEKNSLNILQNVSFCVPRKKGSQMDLIWPEDE